MTKERTFTKEEVLQMIDEAMRCVKGGDDYPAFGTDQDKEYQLYGAGISFVRGWMETGMNYKITGEFVLPSRRRQKGERDELHRTRKKNPDSNVQKGIR